MGWTEFLLEGASRLPGSVKGIDADSKIEESADAVGGEGLFQKQNRGRAAVAAIMETRSPTKT